MEILTGLSYVHYILYSTESQTLEYVHYSVKYNLFLFLNFLSANFLPLSFIQILPRRSHCTFIHGKSVEYCEKRNSTLYIVYCCVEIYTLPLYSTSPSSFTTGTPFLTAYSIQRSEMCRVQRMLTAL